MGCPGDFGDVEAVVAFCQRICIHARAWGRSRSEKTREGKSWPRTVWSETWPGRSQGTEKRWVAGAEHSRKWDREAGSAFHPGPEGLGCQKGLKQGGVVRRVTGRFWLQEDEWC